MRQHSRLPKCIRDNHSRFVSVQLDWVLVVMKEAQLELALLHQSDLQLAEVKEVLLGLQSMVELLHMSDLTLGEMLAKQRNCFII